MTEVYLISNVSHFNGTVPETSQLATEIGDSFIAKPLVDIERVGDAINITFVSQISGADQTILTGLVSSHVPIISIGDTVPIYDAVVDAEGGGDYLLPSAAFAAGATRVFVKAGTYNETANIVLPDGAIFTGQSMSRVNIKFGNAAYQIISDACMGVMENTGTISITSNTNTVTGVGTTFTNLNAGNFINLNRTYYKISNISSDTSLTLMKTFYGRGISGASYCAQAMFMGINICNMTISGSFGTGLYLRALIDSSISHVTMCTSKSGLEILDSYMMTIESFIIQNNPSHGGIITNCQSIRFLTGAAYNNGGNGYRVKGNSSNILFCGVTISNNAGDGVYITGTSSNITLCGCAFRNNNSKGIHSTADSSRILIDNCNIINNALDGIYMAGPSGLISSCLLETNGGIGMTLVSGSDDTIVDSNIFSGNTSHGMSIASDNCVITGNRCKNNGGDGCLVVAGANTVTIKTNRFSGNTAFDFTDSGTGTIKDL